MNSVSDLDSAPPAIPVLVMVRLCTDFLPQHRILKIHARCEAALIQIKKRPSVWSNIVFRDVSIDRISSAVSGPVYDARYKTGIVSDRAFVFC